MAALTFAAFVLFLFIPAVALVMRAMRGVAISAAVVVIAAAPWFFLRKAIGMPLLFDVVSAAVVLICALRFAREPLNVMKQEITRSRWLIGVLALIFVLVWLGYDVRAGSEVRYYGLFAIDFGPLVSVVATLRASPSLPLGLVAGGGPLNYHWLYFTLPAILTDFLGVTIPAANALILANFLIAVLLVLTLASIVRDQRVVAIVVFAPLTIYYYEVIASRIGLAPLTRNYLLLSPLNSMIVFGNNTFALVLAVLSIVQLERWNSDGRIADLIAGVILLAAIIGYSVTLVVPLAMTFIIWTLLGRVRRPIVALLLAALAGALAIAIFFAIGVLGHDSSRHIAVAFDNGAFLRIAIFGMLPLWTLVVLTRRRFSIFHVLIASCFIVPTLLTISGSATGQIDFSMKTATLMAIAFAPLIDWPSLIGIVVVLLGVGQSAAYVAQFPYYRLTNSTAHNVSIPADYHDALVWIRDHTPVTAIVADPASVPVWQVAFPAMVGERRVSLPTAYTKTYVIATQSGAPAAADYLVVRGDVNDPHWRLAHRSGAWTIYSSTLK